MMDWHEIQYRHTPVNMGLFFLDQAPGWHFCIQWYILTTFRWISIKFDTDVHGSQMTYPFFNNFIFLEQYVLCKSRQRPWLMIQTDKQIKPEMTLNLLLLNRTIPFSNPPHKQPGFLTVGKRLCAAQHAHLHFRIVMSRTSPGSHDLPKKVDFIISSLTAVVQVRRWLLVWCPSSQHKPDSEPQICV